MTKLPVHDFSPNGVGNLRIHQFLNSLDLAAVAQLVEK